MVSREEAYSVIGCRPITQGSRERFKHYLYCRQNGLWTREVSGYHPVAERAMLERFCPALNVSEGYPPALLLHGDMDTDVPYEQSVVMARRLAPKGIPHRLITVKGGGHGFDRDLGAAGTIRALDAVIEFLQHRLS